ncbi:MAG: rare lipoprotein A [Alphaproteobacteria bacterium]
MVTCACVLLALAGCTSAPKGRYNIAQDTAPNFDYGKINYDEVVPKSEPHNKWTSRPYKVLGKQYYPMATATGFEEAGSASWYGQKFHGHKTANGEIFDMFALTAAHKTLPLPSFVRVSNVKNGKSVIVRVNDRGPFYGNRIIDLSYGAAKKLGYHKYGVADVKLEVLHINEAGEIRIGSNTQLYIYDNGELVAKQPPSPIISETTLLAQNKATETTREIMSSGLFVQVMAMENGDKAQNLATGLSNLLQVPNIVPKIANIYRLQLGPLATEQKAKHIIKELKKIGFEQAFTVEVLP